jgi:serine/threonine protein kinase
VSGNVATYSIGRIHALFEHDHSPFEITWAVCTVKIAGAHTTRAPQVQLNGQGCLKPSPDQVIICKGPTTWVGFVLFPCFLHLPVSSALIRRMGLDSTSTETSASTDDTDASDPSGLQPGDVLSGRYRIVEQLGSGGYGQVLSAEDLGPSASGDQHSSGDHRRVAIKILRADAGSRDPAALARMRQEAEILGALDHPNIVELYNIGTSDHGEFMVMELLEGDSLDEIMDLEGPADAESARPVVKQLLNALVAAHDKQVLHRDLKPDNIILVHAPDEPGGKRAKLLDFGVAKAGELLDDDPDEGITLVKTRAGGFVGTPRYCAPEMAVGDPAGPSADMFSLGLVVSEWLTGKARIDADKQNAVLALLIQPEPLDVSDCPESWQPWLARMIDKDPDQRYRSAREALDGFEALVEHRGDDADLAATEKQPQLERPGPPGDHVSETAKTLVREKPAFARNPNQTPPDAPSAGLGKSIARFLLIAALTCGVVLLVLLLVRFFL